MFNTVLKMKLRYSSFFSTLLAWKESSDRYYIDSGMGWNYGCTEHTIENLSEIGSVIFAISCPPICKKRSEHLLRSTAVTFQRLRI